MASLRHEIPTHLNVEDKPFYGLSARQFTDLIAGLGGTYSLWNQTPGWPPAARLMLVALSLLVALSVAVLKPGGRRLEAWLFVALHYVVTPKVTVWQRPAPRDADWAANRGDWAELTPMRPSWAGATA